MTSQENVASQIHETQHQFPNYQNQQIYQQNQHPQQRFAQPNSQSSLQIGTNHQPIRYIQNSNLISANPQLRLVTQNQIPAQPTTINPVNFVAKSQQFYDNNQHHNQLISEDLHRQRQAEATSPHWHAVLPSQPSATRNNEQFVLNLRGRPNLQHQQHQWAIPMGANEHIARQQRTIDANGRRLVALLPRAEHDTHQLGRLRAPLQNSLGISTPMQTVADTSAQTDSEIDNDSNSGSDQDNTDAHTVAANQADSAPSDENSNHEQASNGQNDASDPDSDTGNSNNENPNLQQSDDQILPQDEQDEQKAARRSFSESQEEASERDSRGRPISRHHSHLINGKPAQSEEQIQAARDVGAQKFDSIVNEIEQSEPETPEYDEQEPAQQENQPTESTSQQQGDESRLVKSRIDAPKNKVNNQLTNSNNFTGTEGNVKYDDVDNDDDQVISSDLEPKLKKEKHQHKLKESLTAKQWDDSQGNEPKANIEEIDEENENNDSQEDQQKKEDDPEIARQKMESESRNDHVEFADLDLLSDPSDFPFMSTSPTFDLTPTTKKRRRRRRRSADPIELSNNVNNEQADSAGLRHALIDVIDRIEQKNGSKIINTNKTNNYNNVISTNNNQLPIELELRAPPSEESMHNSLEGSSGGRTSSIGDIDDANYAINEELHPEERQDYLQSNGHFYGPDQFNNSAATFYNNATTSDIQLASNLTGYNQYPADATIGLTALSQAQANYTQLQPVNGYYPAPAPSPAPIPLPTPQPIINYNNQNIEPHQQQQQYNGPEYQSSQWPIEQGPSNHQTNSINSNEVANVYPNYELRPSPMPMGSKAYSQTDHKKKKMKKKDEKISIKKKVKKKKKKKIGEKMAKGKSYKKKMAAHRGAMKKRKHKMGKKMAKGYKEFKGATKGSKGKKGIGERGAKKGSLLYKDKGFKKRGFKKAYQKLESGDHKTYFDEFRDKDHKKKWKDFKDKHQFR